MILRLVVILFALGLGYCALCLVRPTRRCGRCRGTRRAKRRLGLLGKTAQCRKCRGRGKHKRLGATAVHRFAWSVLLGPLMEQRHERIKERNTRKERELANVQEQRAGRS
jgi:hypothetical protein